MKNIILDFNKIYRLSLIGSLILCASFTDINAQSTLDSDMDGIIDINDEDNDNDGIQDFVECPGARDYSETTFGGNSVTALTAEDAIVTIEADDMITFQANSFIGFNDGTNLKNRIIYTFPYDITSLNIFVANLDLLESGIQEYLDNFSVSPSRVTGEGEFSNGRVNPTVIKPADDAPVLALYWDDLPLGTRTVSYDYNRKLTSDRVDFVAWNICYDKDGDGKPNQLDSDSDGDGCFDAVEAGHTDPDLDGILGSSPVTVNINGVVTGQGGYTGIMDAVWDASIADCSDCSEIFTVTAGADTAETCPVTPVTINASTLLANDNASNGVALKVQELTLDNEADGTLVDNNNSTWTFTPATNISGDITMSYLVKAGDESLFFEDNGHFYEFVTANNITWEDAKSEAATKRKDGLRGYLATITTQGENEFIQAKLEGQGWIGASDAAEEGNWKWITGPEAGTQFWSGDGSGMAVSGKYSNWKKGTSSPNEPNDLNGEDYGHVFPDGGWNDYKSPAAAGQISGFVVEYGGLEDCPDGFTAIGILTIKVVDGQNPVITCPDNIEINIEPGTNVGIPSTTEPTPTDNCSISTYTTRVDNDISGVVYSLYNVTPGQIFTEDTYPIGVNTYSYFVTDASGNTATCSYTITVIDECSEVFTVTAGADTAETCPVTPVTISATTLLANDNASNGIALKVQELTLDDDADGTLVDNNNGTWTFTSAANVSGDITLSYLVKAADESLFFEDNGHFYEFVTANDVTWEDAKSAAAAMRKNGLRGYLATITTQGENEFIQAKLEGQGWIGASDAEEEGNWKWVTGPEAGTQFWSGNASGMAVSGRYSNWDNSEPNDFLTGEDYGHLLTDGEWNDYDSPAVAGRISGYVVEYGGLKDCPDGFTDNGTLTIKVVDREDPVISCVDDATFPTRAGECVNFITYSLTATDDCGTPELDLSIVSGSAFQVGNTTVVVTATDASGNSSTCSFVITILDNEAPVRPNLTDVIGCGSALVSVPTTTDNCSGTITSTTSDPLQYSTPGTYTVRWNFDDGNGNSVNADQRVIVNRLTASIEAPTTELDCNNSSVSINASASGGDNNNLSYAWSNGDMVSSIEIIQPGVYTVTVIDNTNGCNDTQSIEITFKEDDTAPVISCIDDSTFPTRAGECVNFITYSLTATDDCGTPELDLSIVSGSAFQVGNTTVVVTATDASGNSSTCSFVITILDNEAPVRPNLTDVIGCGSALVSVPTTTDNCSGTITSTTSDPLQYSTPGTYTVRWNFDDGNGNSIDVDQMVRVTSQGAIIFASTTQVDCNNETITLDASGSGGDDPNLSFRWSDNSTNASTTVNSEGTYSVTVTDNNTGCTGSTSVNVTENKTKPFPSISAPVTQIDCNNPSVTLDASGSGGDDSNLSFTWSDGTSTSMINVTDGGQYVVTITDRANGCTNTESVTITKDIATPMVNVSQPDLLTCINTTTTLDASSSSGGGALTYAWSNGLSSPSITVRDPGNITVTVTDSGNGCTATFTASVFENVQKPFPFISAPITVIDCNNPSVTLDASESGGDDSDLSFSWSTNSSSASIDVSIPGQYTVTVTDRANGCTNVESTTITEDKSKPTALINTPSTVLDCEVTSIRLDAAGSTGGGLTYLWSNGSTQSNTDITASGEYTVTVTKGDNGCTDSRTITISENKTLPNAVIAAPSVLNCAVTSTVLDASGSSGIGELTYTWSNGGNTSIVEVMNPGNYTVTVIDNSNSCFSIETVTVSQDITKPTARIDTENTVLDCGTESITLDGSNSTGGVEGVVYLWSTGSQDASIEIRSAGEYTLAVGDPINGCVDEISITISSDEDVPTATIDALSTRLDCNTSMITLDASASMGTGDLTYSWSNGSIASSIEVTEPGDYSVTVTKTDNGCEASSTVTIIEDMVIPMALIENTENQLDCNTASISLDASKSSGANNISYLWSNTSTSSVISVTDPGTYTVTITDMVNGCTATNAVVITEDMVVPTAEIEAAGTQLDCGTSSITLDASSSTGNNNIKYDWSTGSDKATIEIGSAGTYTVTITDMVNGCIATEEVTITQDEDVPTANINPSSTQLDCNTTSITLDASISSGNNTLDYQWSNNGGNTSSITITEPGDYTVMVIDQVNGCDASRTITITEDVVLPSALIETTDTQLDCNTSSISLDASSSSGNNDIAFRWSTNSVISNISVTDPGTYTVTITDMVNGCTATNAVVITEDMVVPTAEIEASSTKIDCENSTVILNASGSNGNNELKYLWSNQNSNSSITVGAAGEYSVTVTDEINGCTDVSTITITQDDDIPSAMIQSTSIQLDCTNPSILLDASDSEGQNSISFLWSNDSIESTITIDDAGTYTVTVSDDVNGCTSVRSITITEDFESPVVEISVPELLTCITTSTALDASGAITQEDISYLWSDGRTDASINVNSPGEYTVTITDDSNGCFSTKSVTVAQDITVPLAELIVPITHIDCRMPVSTLDASGSSSANGVIYLWSNGSIQPTIEVREGGSYQVTITDEISGCAVIESTIITKDDSGDILVNVNITFDNNPGETSWSIWTEFVSEEDQPIKLAQGGPYVEGEDDSTSQTFTVCLQEGCYDFFIQDTEGNGLNDGTFSITTAFEDTLVADTGFDSFIKGFNFCVEEQNFEASITTSNGTHLNCNIPALTLEGKAKTQGEIPSYQWTDGSNILSTNIALEITTAGTYFLIISDADHVLMDTTSIVITEDFKPPVIDIAPWEVEDCSDPNALLDASESIGQGGLTYNWLTGSTESAINVTATGNYGLTVTDNANGCTSTTSVDVLFDDLEQVFTDFLTGSTACVGDTMHFIDYSIFEGMSTLNFFWDFGNGDISMDRDPLYVYDNVGDYTVSLELSGTDCPSHIIEKEIFITTCPKKLGGKESYAQLTPTINSGSFSIKAVFPEPSDVRIDIYDFSGQSVHTRFIPQTSQYGQVFSLENDGVYIVTIRHQFGVESFRTIVFK